jgi:hypothetical protein
MTNLDEYQLVIDLTKTESDSDWLRAMRLKKACEAGDKVACDKYKEMQTTKLYSREEIEASKEVEE